MHAREIDFLCAVFRGKKDFLHGKLAEGDFIRLTPLLCQSGDGFPFSDECIFFHFLIHFPVGLKKLLQF